MNRFYSLMAASLVFVSVLALPVATHAQSTQDMQDGTYNQAQPGTVDSTNTTNDDRGFDWRWLLPLLAVPVVYFIIRKNDSRDEYRDYSDYPAGAKGGRSRVTDEDEEE